MGRKIEFFIDNDNGNVKIKGLFKAQGRVAQNALRFKAHRKRHIEKRSRGEKHRHFKFG